MDKKYFSLLLLVSWSLSFVSAQVKDPTRNQTKVTAPTPTKKTPKKQVYSYILTTSDVDVKISVNGEGNYIVRASDGVKKLPGEQGINLLDIKPLDGGNYGFIEKINMEKRGNKALEIRLQGKKDALAEKQQEQKDRARIEEQERLSEIKRLKEVEKNKAEFNSQKMDLEKAYEIAKSKNTIAGYKEYFKLAKSKSMNYHVDYNECCKSIAAILTKDGLDISSYRFYDRYCDESNYPDVYIFNAIRFKFIDKYRAEENEKQEDEYWDRALAKKTKKGYERYKLIYPNGRYLKLANQKIIVLANPDGFFITAKEGKKYYCKLMKDGNKWILEDIEIKEQTDLGWETAKTACPKGWHVPNYKEWKKLRLAYKGNGKKDYEISEEAYKALVGLDAIGFTSTDYWSSTPQDNTPYSVTNFSSYDQRMHTPTGKSSLHKGTASCRCIQD